MSTAVILGYGPDADFALAKRAHYSDLHWYRANVSGANARRDSFNLPLINPFAISHVVRTLKRQHVDAVVSVGSFQPKWTGELPTEDMWWVLGSVYKGSDA